MKKFLPRSLMPFVLALGLAAAGGAAITTNLGSDTPDRVSPTMVVYECPPGERPNPQGKCVKDK